MELKVGCILLVFILANSVAGWCHRHHQNYRYRYGYHHYRKGHYGKSKKIKLSEKICKLIKKIPFLNKYYHRKPFNKIFYCPESTKPRTTTARPTSSAVYTSSTPPETFPATHPFTTVAIPTTIGYVAPFTTAATRTTSKEPTPPPEPTTPGKTTEPTPGAPKDAGDQISQLLDELINQAPQSKDSAADEKPINTVNENVAPDDRRDALVKGLFAMLKDEMHLKSGNGVSDQHESDDDADDATNDVIRSDDEADSFDIELDE